MYDKILVPYDGTDESVKGATHGVELAAALGATVHALYVIDLPGAPRTPLIRADEEEVRERYEAYAKEVLAEVEELAGDHGVDCRTARRTGAITEEIVTYAEDEGMDAIVMGSAYRGKLGNLIGGTMDKVVRSSPVPVISNRMSVDDI